LLPALAWGEKNGTVTNSERRISRQRAFLPPPGEARGDWWIVTQVARRLGFEHAFGYESPHDIFREHAALSGFENHGARLFDISGLAHLSRREYDELQPLHWPMRADRRNDSARLFDDGHFATADGRARFIAIGRRQPAYQPDANFPLVLNTGRIRDQWHTMTRTGKSARLSAHTPEPYAELHPTDAATHGIADGALVRVESRWGRAVVRARVNEGQQLGSVFVPMHWSREYAATGCIDAVVNPATDPLSGQPESKHTPIAIKPYRPAWHGFLLSREALRLPATTYRVSVRGAGYWRYELAGDSAPADWGDWVRSLSQDADWQWLDYSDHAARRYRAAAIAHGCLQLCVFIAPQPLLPPREWLGGLFARTALEESERLSLLAGRAPAQDDAGPIVCSCFQVGLNTLTRAIREQGLATPEALGAALKAGTNCGSCVPELRGLIVQGRRERAA
jgi:assimilatory nitrate reductase catalytic subunit